MALELFLCEVCKLKLECQKKGHLQIMNAYIYIIIIYQGAMNQSYQHNMCFWCVFTMHTIKDMWYRYMIQATIRYTVIGMYINLVFIYRQMHWQPV
jgi:hypothetical protein